MGNVGDLYRDLKEDRRRKKLSNAANSLALLKLKQVPYRILNALNWHLLIDERIDFWPSTGKWRERQTGKQGRGVQNLIRFFRLNKKENEK